jgi:hypothetical protein
MKNVKEMKRDRWEGVEMEKRYLSILQTALAINLAR